MFATKLLFVIAYLRACTKCTNLLLFYGTECKLETPPSGGVSVVDVKTNQLRKHYHVNKV